jgi:hypothetical protein
MDSLSRTAASGSASLKLEQDTNSIIKECCIALQSINPTLLCCWYPEIGLLPHVLTAERCQPSIFEPKDYPCRVGAMHPNTTSIRVDHCMGSSRLHTVAAGTPSLVIAGSTSDEEMPAVALEVARPPHFAASPSSRLAMSESHQYSPSLPIHQSQACQEKHFENRPYLCVQILQIPQSDCRGRE